MARIRSFIGVAITDEIQEKAAALQQLLGRSGVGVKWVARENLHITMLFLGEVDERDLTPVCRAVNECTRYEAPFGLHVSGVGGFPSSRRPKVIWAGVADGSDSLRRLHAAIEAKLLDLGVHHREERGYTPHLTLGRTRGEADGLALAPELARLLAWEGGRCTVNEVLVMSSELRRDRPEYAVLARCRLGGE